MHMYHWDFFCLKNKLYNSKYTMSAEVDLSIETNHPQFFFFFFFFTSLNKFTTRLTNVALPFDHEFFPRSHLTVL